MKLPIHCYPKVLGARILRAVRIFGERDYEHFLFKMWLDHDHDARAAKRSSSTREESPWR